MQYIDYYMVSDSLGKKVVTGAGCGIGHEWLTPIRLDVVDKVANFLVEKLLAKPAKTYHRIGSYGMKHIAERAIGEYVSNGEMMVAWHKIGVSFRPYNSINAEAKIYLSAKELRKYE